MKLRLLVTVLLLLAVAACQTDDPTAPTAGASDTLSRVDASRLAPGPNRNPDAVGENYGDIDGTVSVDEDVPAISNLHAPLLVALRQASNAAAADGVIIEVTSGWRSRAYQRALLDRAVLDYGSQQEALKWVATPRDSAHVTGMAVDVGPTDAAYWMAQHGAAFGLCQTFANEVWHYELLTDPGMPCPTPRPDGSS